MSNNGQIQDLQQEISDLRYTVGLLRDGMKDRIKTLETNKKYTEDQMKNIVELEIKAYTKNKALHDPMFLEMNSRLKKLEGALLCEIKERISLGQMYENRLKKLEEDTIGPKN